MNFRRFYVIKNLKIRIKEVVKALRGSVKSFQVTIIEKRDPAKQLYVTTTDVFKELGKSLSTNRGLKFYATLHITLKKKKIRILDDGESEEYYEFKNAYFNSKAFTITNSDQIIDALGLSSEEINNRVVVWLLESSQWVVEAIIGHYINIVKYIPLRGNSYIPLPEELRNSKKGLINLKNEDNKCFLWCHVRHLNPMKKDLQRIKQSDKEFAKKLDYSGNTFPVTIKQMELRSKLKLILIFLYIMRKESFQLEFPKKIIKIIWSY